MANGTRCACVGTHSFYSNFSGVRQSEVADWVKSTWQDEVETSSDYNLIIDVWGESNVEIPSGTLPYSGPLYKRRVAGDNWLEDNWSYYTAYDSIIIFDVYGGDGEVYGASKIGHAGDSSNRSCIIDLYHELEERENFGDGMSSEFNRVGMEGVAFHELAHQYCAIHDDAGSYSDCTATLMYSPGAGVIGCFDNCSSPDLIDRRTSSCTRSVVRCFINGGMYGGSCSKC